MGKSEVYIHQIVRNGYFWQLNTIMFFKLLKNDRVLSENENKKIKIFLERKG